MIRDGDTDSGILDGNYTHRSGPSLLGKVYRMTRKGQESHHVRFEQGNLERRLKQSCQQTEINEGVDQESQRKRVKRVESYEVDHTVELATAPESGKSYWT